ncbi:MAG TPA: 16S rRNA (adenine(1518)-N(6)/adenine(1519)-N(6))-dimethyltransferase RsmA [Solirubrobacteraceae bacterium]|nr:16S rRNA (adenine(1518)-N(6)/adenine(1519)-N(6))-dimethyltransferase RsmA [Solirubrobacteraceae bacterium]
MASRRPRGRPSGARPRPSGARPRPPATARSASRRTRDLGQNFLRDPNILGVIERASELSARDVVLEVGGGEGVLSAHLAPRVRWLHVVEVDERLRQPLRASLAAHENVTLHWADAMQLDLVALRPPPEKVVANLPYGIAATLILRTVEELPTVTTWVAMVQREVGLRLAAAPGGRDYGASSVLAQLAGEVTVLRAIPRTVFAPVPNVDSVLLRIRRTALAPSPDVRALVAGAFAHRRKTLAGSLLLSGLVAEREPVREALLALGHPADARAERLAPQELVALAEALRP